MQNDSIILVEIENEFRISHRVIAENTGIQEVSVRNLINKYKGRFEKFGRLHFKNEGEDSVKERQKFNSNYRAEKTYFLNELQATQLMTYLKNSEKVMDFKDLLVQQFYEMRNELQNKPKFSENIQQLEERIKLLELSNQALLVFNSAFYNIGITRPEELAITSNRAVKKETEVDFIELAGQKGISTTETYFTVTDLCEYVRKSSDFSEEVKLSVSTKKNDKPRAEKLNNLLRDLGFQERDENNIYRATEKGEKFSDFVQNKSKHSEKTIFHTVWKIDVLGEVF